MEEDIFDWNSNTLDASILPGTLMVGLLKQNDLTESFHGIVRLLLSEAEANALDAETDFVYGSIDNTSPRRGRRRKESYSGSSVASALMNNPESQRKGINIILLHDNNGVTIICNKLYFRKLQTHAISNVCSWAPSCWRGFEIHLSSAGQDSEKLISHISSALSGKGISILNFSTFGSDLILVQEAQVADAQTCFAELAQYGVNGMLRQIHEKTKEQTETEVAFSNGHLIADHVNVLSRKFDAYLTVFAPSFLLVSIQRTALKESTYAIMKQFLNSVDRADSQKGRRITNTERTKDFVDRDTDDSIWAYLSVKDEISLILESTAISDFPDGALIACPQRWKAIKLSGKEIPFDEVGVVKTMLKPYESGVQLLNMSTYATNIALVAENSVDIAIHKIKEFL